MEHVVKESDLEDFYQYLLQEERSPATINKYMRDVKTFYHYLHEKCSGDNAFTKKTVIEYKNWLIQHYSVRSANSMLTAVNGFFQFRNWPDCKVKLFKLQNELYRLEERELSVEEYYKLLDTAKTCGYHKLYHIIQTICSTGIRISELPFITVEAVKEGRAKVYLKGKFREIYLPYDLCMELLVYAQKEGIEDGILFRTKNGKNIDRSNILKNMKKLARLAGVAESKVFPHNLRHLFAVCYYNKERDVCRLADILGHSNINTTRIYTLLSTKQHAKQIEDLGLIYRNDY